MAYSADSSLCSIPQQQQPCWPWQRHGAIAQERSSSGVAQVPVTMIVAIVARATRTTVKRMVDMVFGSRADIETSAAGGVKLNARAFYSAMGSGR